MTALCLDIGTVRTGVAISDPTGLLARPLEAIPGDLDGPGLVAALGPLLTEHAVEAVVVGHPLRLSGEAGPEAERVQALAATLKESLPLPVELWDERLSTVEVRERLTAAGVRRRKRTRAQIDCLAATVILQSWLDHRRAGASRTS